MHESEKLALEHKREKELEYALDELRGLEPGDSITFRRHEDEPGKSLFTVTIRTYR